MSNHEAYNLLSPVDINDWDLPQKLIQIESFAIYGIYKYIYMLHKYF